MREVITLQFGTLANYVGTHFWNTQEAYFTYGDEQTDTRSIEHDVLYRAGMTATGTETYTPRALVYDLKGGFGSLQKYNRLFNTNNESSVSSTWDQGTNTVVAPQYPKHAYQEHLDQLETDPNADHQIDDASIQTWSDYNRIYYHPRSMNTITTHHKEDTIAPFDTYTVGRQSYEDFDREEETFDGAFRFFAEDCDNLQGFQVLTSIDDAFGGFTEGYLNALREEYPKTPVLTFAIQQQQQQQLLSEQHKVLLNRALSMARLSEHSTTYIPLYTPTSQQLKHVPYIHANSHLLYHTSAILAAAIETVSLNYRQVERSPLC
ncbi:tubulin domain-domain-containing protein [Syncephalastrum racemosum]|uniref:Tubulin domain-domain-containing protein n=1 Tax=Syncephalastrum racemosum TaxID=13706 RepID=A0A1X2HQW2_SYNRA|nr:tubulin domain-domain-containing protein [Syncephalastrum racemosum]